MILNNTPTHEAVLSNVGEIGEFRIRNSAKAFSILSSGLYSNKIRAIVRELSCNAVDSHAAAGCADTPFEVHLPSTLEPWFSIRDYGIGLSHDQVTRIYTTYFESTKTDSNDFIGALGLGSKSPFSYTDNFTVTAIQNGVRGIYSAFINGDGVPSIALMSTDQTDQANGVEIKFSVNEHWDYSKFREEAQNVYKHFRLHPVINGNLEIPKKLYNSLDIIPGVHEYDRAANSQRYHTCVAIMGNIAYPMDVPNESGLGDLSALLGCSLEMHFGIGELDFQASREGLSYIPQTIEAIKRKLSDLNDALTIRLAEDANKIENLWERAEFLSKKMESNLWKASVAKYITDTKFPLLTATGHYGRYVSFELMSSYLNTKYNISLKSFQMEFSRNGKTSCSNNYEMNVRTLVGTEVVSEKGWNIDAKPNTTFVINDTKKGAIERVKHHFRTNNNLSLTSRYHVIYVISAVDREKEMDTDGFFAEIMNPPTVVVASTLSKKERKTMRKDVTIVQLVPRDTSNYRANSDDLVWRDAGDADSFDDTKTYYYLPLSAFSMESKYNWLDTASSLGNYLKSFNFGDLNKIKVYGVRKGDIETITELSNWVNLEDHIVSTIKAHSVQIVNGMLAKMLDGYDFVSYNKRQSINKAIKDQDGKYSTLIKAAVALGAGKIEETHDVNKLVQSYDPITYKLIEDSKRQWIDQCKACYAHYPLLRMLECSMGYRYGEENTFSIDKFAEYINSVDSQSKEVV